MPYERHPYFDFEAIPFAHALIGLVAPILTVLAASLISALVRHDEGWIDE